MKKDRKNITRRLTAAAVCVLVMGCVGVNSAAYANKNTYLNSNDEQVINNENMEIALYAEPETTSDDDYKLPWDDFETISRPETSETEDIFSTLPFKWDVKLPKTISLNKSSVTLNVGERDYLSYTVYPEEVAAIYKKASFSSSDTSVANVDSNGCITAVGAGTATISVVSTYDSKISAACTVTVRSVDAESISLNKSELNMKKGDRTSLSYTVYPGNAKAELSWSSSNAGVASVDSSGNVYAKASGSAVITVTANNGVSASCSVSVTTPVENITLSKHSTTVKAGGSEQLSYTITPKDADDKSVTWTSSDTSAVTVDDNGTIKGIKAGSSATVTVTASGGISDSITVKVNDADPTSITINETEKTMHVGDEAALTVTFLPKGSYAKPSWSTSDASIVEVDKIGNITAKKAGTATVYVSANDLKASCKITVKPFDATSVSLNKTTLTMNVGGVESLTAKVLPSNASYELSWSSSDQNIVSVDKNGRLTARKEGTAKITVKTSNGLNDVCTVTVKPVEITGVSLDKTSITLDVGDEAVLVPTLSPSGVSGKLMWSSSKSRIVGVSDSGGIKAWSAGTAIITVKTLNGKTASCTVTVRPVEVGSISLNASSRTVPSGKTFTLYANIKPSDASVKTLTWSSSNTSVASVDSNGQVTAKSDGTAVITATSNNGKTASCKVTVADITAKYVVISGETNTVKVGETIHLSAAVYPSDTKDKTVEWYSLNDEYASVDQNGNVTGHVACETFISARTSNGMVGSYKIKVEPISDVQVNFDPKMQYVELGATAQLSFDPLPAGKKATFTSANPSVLTVDDQGRVTGHKMKMAVVIAVVDGNKSTVYVNVTSNREIREAARKKYAEEILYYVNIEREKAGVPPLELMDDLSYLAQIRTDEQVKEFKEHREKYVIDPFISHTRPNGTPWSTVFEYASIKKKAAAENLIQGAGYTAETCVKRWMDSAGHRANILRANMTHMGIGVEFINIDPDGNSTALCVTQLFIQQ